MNLKCNWCQKEHTISDNLQCMEGDPAHYVCPDCLMVTLPYQSAASGNTATLGMEKRQSERYPIFVPVRIAPQDRGMIVTSALVLDTSESGLRLESKIALREDEDIDLTLLGNKIKFLAAGKVIYSKEVTVEGSPHYQAGIKLLDEFHRVTTEKE